MIYSAQSDIKITDESPVIRDDDGRTGNAAVTCRLCAGFGCHAFTKTYAGGDTTGLGKYAKLEGTYYRAECQAVCQS